MILQRLGVPIYLQVKNYIVDKIKSGELPQGSKIPTERDLAQKLEISRNTVSAAYKELLLEGVLESRQGRGTFVKQTGIEEESEMPIAGSRRERALRIIDEALGKVINLGFTADEFIAIAGIRVREKAEEVKRLRVAVIDDTEEYIDHFIEQIHQVANVRFEPVVLQHLVNGKVPADLLSACDLVVSAAENQAFLAGFIGNSSKLVAVSTIPNLEAVVRLARLSPETKVGIVAQSEKFVTSLQNLLLKTAIENENFSVLLSRGDQAQLQQFVNMHEVIVVAEGQETVVRKLTRGQQEIIAFYYEIDQGSLNQLVARLNS